MKWIKKFWNSRTQLQKNMTGIWAVIALLLGATVPVILFAIASLVGFVTIAWYTLDALHGE